ncbi:MAG: zinc ribbon domain-containing protein [Ruminococcus sp.]|uniref:zinc ribbon domain-containing protein n=1 Tax=Ruminococcus sp. TaxID=41978 RepID=UPI0025D8BC86|nr:zinc ribbon domain-containing protein [Ruminococcus sp.]MBR0529075.1 zinc ribbon domain-containing protein [Ruminococcus sp.]
MSKLCGKCGRQVPDSFMFCQYCGHNISTFESSSNVIDYYTRVPNVRKLCWGDSKEYVKSIEGYPIDESCDCLVYRVKLCGYDSVLLLDFNNNGLYRAGYMYDTNYNTQTSILLSQYYTIVDRLTEKFGTPEHDEVVLNTSMKYCDTKYDAVELGYLIIKDNWNSKMGSNISSAIANINNKVCYMVTFEDEKYIPPAPEAGF